MYNHAPRSSLFYHGRNEISESDAGRWGVWGTHIIFVEVN